MARIEKAFYWICLVFVIYTVFGFKILPNILQSQLVKNLDENLTLKSSIEKVEFNPYNFKTKIHNFKLSKEDKPTLKADELLLDINLLTSILKQYIAIENIQTKNLFLDIIQHKDGTLNLSKLLKETKENTKDESSSQIAFLISKLSLQNAQINFTKEDKKPYKLNINNINYNSHDLGTLNNALSSNNLNLNINKNTNLDINAAFRLQPFSIYGKASLKKLNLKEVLDYEANSFNFAINKEANLNLDLDYNINLKDKPQVHLSSNNFNINNLKLFQNKISILSFVRLASKNLNFDLQKQKIELNKLNIDKLNTKMILEKQGLNFANLIIPSTKKEKAKKSDNSKPWLVNINTFNLKNANFSFADKINNLLVEQKNFTTSLGNLRLNGSNLVLNSLKVNNPKVVFKDNKNKLDIQTSNTNVVASKIEVKNNKINIPNITINKGSVNFLDDKSKIKLNTNKTQIQIKNLAVSGSKVAIKSSTLKTSNFNFEDLNSKLNIKLPSANIQAKALDINGANVNINEIKLNNPKLELKDIQNRQNIDVKNINVLLNKLALKDSNLLINSIKVTKQSVNLKDLKNNIELKSKNLNLTLENISQKNDSFTLRKIHLKEPLVELFDTKEKTKIIAKNLDLSVLEFLNNKNKLAVKSTLLNNPELSVILPKNRTSKKKQKTKTSKSNSTKKIEIGPLKIKNATFNFEDKNLPIPFKTTVSKLNGNISKYKNDKNSISKLEVNGTVDKYGTAKITGEVDASSIKLLTDVNMVFKNISMKNFTPYSEKFVARKLDSGKLDLDLKYNIKKSNLKAQNEILIKKLKLGKTVNSKDAVSLPLDLAVALLEDSSGVIDLNLPVSGNVDDPKFSIAPIVWKAFTNLIMKAITAPFSLLGAIFGFEANEINSVDFEFGTNQIQAIQKEPLDKITKILKKRPNLKIKLEPTYDSKKDLFALQKEILQKEIDKKIPDKNTKDFEEKYIEFLENKYEDYGKTVATLKQSYTKGNNFDKKTYKQKLEQYLISKQKVDKSALIKLAKKRVLNIKDYLLKKSISIKQIKLSNKIKEKINSKKELKLDLKIDK